MGICRKQIKKKDRPSWTGEFDIKSVSLSSPSRWWRYTRVPIEIEMEETFKDG